MENNNNSVSSALAKNDPSVSNAELDAAFAKLQMYLYATDNSIVRDLLYKDLKTLSNEVIKRDNSMSFRIQQHLYALKKWIKKENKNGRK